MNPLPANPSVPFTVIVPTIYGQMLLNRHDINQTNALFKSGRAIDHSEIELLAALLGLAPPDPVAVDVGANFGAYTLRLAAAAGPRGRVHAFEPQRVLCNMVAGSAALNGFCNVICHAAALGATEGEVELPQFDYNQPLNFGSIEFGPEQREALHQTRGHDPALREFVPVTTLDRLALPRLDLLKIDAEGMEMAVLDGAGETLVRHRPVLYVEFLKSDRAALLARLRGRRYTLYEVAANFLGIPEEFSHRFNISGVSPVA
jgi:FkbM family methyltransferase